MPHSQNKALPTHLLKNKKSLPHLLNIEFYDFLEIDLSFRADIFGLVRDNHTNTHGWKECSQIRPRNGKK